MACGGNSPISYENGLKVFIAVVLISFLLGNRSAGCGATGSFGSGAANPNNVAGFRSQQSSRGFGAAGSDPMGEFYRQMDQMKAEQRGELKKREE